MNKALALIHNAKPADAFALMQNPVGQNWREYGSFGKPTGALAMRKSGRKPETDGIIAVYQSYPGN